MLLWPKLMALGALLCFAIAGGAAIASYNLFQQAKPYLSSCDDVVGDGSGSAESTEASKQAAERCAKGTDRQLVSYYAGGAAMACAVLGVMLLAFAAYFRKRLQKDATYRGRPAKTRF